MAKTKVRLTIWPEHDTEVDEEEVANLRSQGLLIEDAPAAQPPAGKPAKATTEGTAK